MSTGLKFSKDGHFSFDSFHIKFSVYHFRIKS